MLLKSLDSIQHALRRVSVQEMEQIVFVQQPVRYRDLDPEHFSFPSLG